MNRLDGSSAVVTGGTQGLGAAIARQFAEAGAAGVVTCGRSQEKGAAVARAITSDTGCPVHFVQADLSRVADCRAVIAAADRHFGKLDILVNAAGVTDRGTILDTSEELFDAIFAVNVRGPFFLIQDAAKLMIRDDIAGAIVNIGSMSALSGQPFITAYSASKGALATLTKNSAFALMCNRIRVNQVNMGWMDTEGEDRIQRRYHGAGDDWLEKASASLPFGRLVSPEEIARTVAFMASKDAGMLTGTVVNFDQSVWGAYEAPAPTPHGPLGI